MAEDGPVETAQAVVLLGGGLVGAYIAFALRREIGRVWALMYGALAIGLLLVAGEEISWGQRLFRIETPEWLAENRQEEANLHNLPGVGLALHAIVRYGLWLAIALSLLRMWWRPMEQWRPCLWVPAPVLIPTWLCFISYS